MKVFCARPFEWLYVMDDGEAHLCCPGRMTIRLGNVLHQDLLAIWRGAAAEACRDAILDQSFRHCSWRCRYLPGPAGCVVNEPPRRLPTDRIPNLGLAHDPTCNLRCESCRREPRGQSPLSREIQDRLLASGVLDHVDCLYAMGGGDPLASSLYWELLQELPRSRYPRLELMLHTNAVLLDERAWERLGDDTRRIREIHVSVDAATPETYRQNRGADLEATWRNISGIAERQIPLWLSFVVQENNFREIPTFTRQALDVGARGIIFSALENWDSHSESEHASRAVHQPQHPRHQELLEILADPVLEHPSICLAGLPKRPT